MIGTPFLSSLLLLLSLSARAAPVESTISARQDGDVEAQWAWLHFEGCSAKQREAIKKAHENAVDMAEHVSNIDFGNDPGAMDYFGPSALNKDWQGNIQSVYNNIATFRQSYFWPGFKMNARCGSKNDEKYQNKCSSGGVVAYQWNTEKGDDGKIRNKGDAVSNMHFCEKFFHYDTLEKAIKDNKDVDDFKWRYDISKYKNQGMPTMTPLSSFFSALTDFGTELLSIAYVMLHEMMHATVMTYEENANRRIVDMAMHMYEYVRKPDSRDYKRKLVLRDVYGPENCKILARTSRDSITKEGITLNADTYAQYALSKWVQSKLDNQYPWLPLADRQAEDWFSRGGAMFVISENGTFSVNTASLSNDTLTTADTDNNDDAFTLHDVDDGEVITLDLTDGLAATEYTDDYNAGLFQWSTYVRTPEPECAKTGQDAPSDRASFTVDEAEEQIKAFCKAEGNYGTVLTTFINQGTGATRDGAPKVLGLDWGVPVGDRVLWLGAYYGGGSWNGNRTWPQGGPGLRDTDLCLDRFRTILHGCDTDTRVNKYGGSLTEWGLVYQILGVGSVDDAKPLGTVPVGENGGIECKDTTDKMYDDLGKATCTCWYRDLPDQQSIFGTPKEGTCADVDYRPAWTYFEDPDYRPIEEEGVKGAVVF
ncbi:hypothetical protein BJY04DRAFT_212553 [Aspergillus karnatakaensis]|uniref:uncharacterized protein n=1 Tax=Aspergillus karnatakaensis TaxID=1810916 RepID=UPI003CCDE902